MLYEKKIASWLAEQQLQFDSARARKVKAFQEAGVMTTSPQTSEEALRLYINAGFLDSVTLLENVKDFWARNLFTASAKRAHQHAPIVPGIYWGKGRHFTQAIQVDSRIWVPKESIADLRDLRLGKQRYLADYADLVKADPVAAAYWRKMR